MTIHHDPRAQAKRQLNAMRKLVSTPQAGNLLLFCVTVVPPVALIAAAIAITYPFGG